MEVSSSARVSELRGSRRLRGGSVESKAALLSDALRTISLAGSSVSDLSEGTTVARSIQGMQAEIDFLDSVSLPNVGGKTLSLLGLGVTGSSESGLSLSSASLLPTVEEGLLSMSDQCDAGALQVSDEMTMRRDIDEASRIKLGYPPFSTSRFGNEHFEGIGDEMSTRDMLGGDPSSFSGYGAADLAHAVPQPVEAPIVTLDALGVLTHLPQSNDVRVRFGSSLWSS